MTGISGGRMDFYLGWLRNPKRIGAIAPTSVGMARKMAGPVRPDSPLPVLELGPGTGVITKAILERGVKPENLFSVEFTAGFLPGLRQRFPGVNFIHGDAFDMPRIARDLGIDRFDTVVSALPLLNFPAPDRIRLVENMLDLLPPGRMMVQFSYGRTPPVPGRPDGFDVRYLTSALLNLPPARLWTYQRNTAESGDADPKADNN